MATPTVNDRDGPAQLPTVVPFVPSSLRHAVVVQKPTRPRSGRLALSGGDAAQEYGAELPLSARLRGFPGSLPVEAQARLQWPFVNGDVFDRRHHDHHHRFDNRFRVPPQDHNSDTLMQPSAPNWFTQYRNSRPSSISWPCGASVRCAAGACHGRP